MPARELRTMHLTHRQSLLHRGYRGQAPV